MMLKEFGLLLIGVPVVLGQTASAPVWKEFSIGPATRNQMGSGPAGIRAEGILVKRALARAWGLPDYRVLGPDWLASQRYAMRALVNDPKDLQPLLREELTRRFNMVAHTETREVTAFVLRTLNGQPPQQLQDAGSGANRGGEGLGMGPASVGGFADTLSDLIQRPVIDETHVEGSSFHFSLSWKDTGFSSMRTAVRQQLGFDLTEEKRSIEVLVVEHIEPLHF